MPRWRPTSQILHRLTIDTRPWLPCDECFHVDQYVEVLLTDPSAELPAMRGHLADCSACAEEAASLLLLGTEDGGVDSAAALRRLPATS